MNPATPIRRMYNLEDAGMLQFCSTILLSYMAHVSDFTAFDAELVVSFGNAFKAAIEDAYTFGTDRVLVSIRGQNTDDVKAKMAEIGEAFQFQKYFIKKAFADVPGTWNEFGFNTFSSCRKNADKMLQFVTNQYETSVKYETQLAAVGYGPLLIAALTDFKNQLQELITTQQLSKNQRYTATNQRIVLLNMAWAMCSRICIASKRVYATNYGMYQVFLIAKRRGKKKVEE